MKPSIRYFGGFIMQNIEIWNINNTQTKLVERWKDRYGDQFKIKNWIRKRSMIAENVVTSLFEEAKKLIKRSTIQFRSILGTINCSPLLFVLLFDEENIVKN
jgi:hypothetical protein